MNDAKKTENELIIALEKAILDILNNPKAKPGERSAAIANGIRLVTARHKVIGGDDVADFFGTSAGGVN